jgi:hypothetical protein
MRRFSAHRRQTAEKEAGEGWRVNRPIHHGRRHVFLCESMASNNAAADQEAGLLFMQNAKKEATGRRKSPLQPCMHIPGPQLQTCRTHDISRHILLHTNTVYVPFSASSGPTKARQSQPEPSPLFPMGGERDDHRCSRTDQTGIIATDSKLGP